MSLDSAGLWTMEASLPRHQGAVAASSTSTASTSAAVKVLRCMEDGSMLSSQPDAQPGEAPAPQAEESTPAEGGDDTKTDGESGK